jgi:hypothetical protein
MVGLRDRADHGNRVLVRSAESMGIAIRPHYCIHVATILTSDFLSAEECLIMLEHGHKQLLKSQLCSLQMPRNIGRNISRISCFILANKAHDIVSSEAEDMILIHSVSCSRCSGTSPTCCWTASPIPNARSTWERAQCTRTATVLAWAYTRRRGSC